MQTNINEFKNNVTWAYKNTKYTINQEKIIRANCFENENTILVLCGSHAVETHLYAYDFYGNFKFEVLPPENYMIMCSKNVSLKGKGVVMGIECKITTEESHGFGNQYAVDSTDGSLTYVGRTRF